MTTSPRRRSGSSASRSALRAGKASGAADGARRAARTPSTTEGRRERDSMGEMVLPTDALFGATTQRAVENFPVSDRTVSLEMIQAFVLLKRACAEVNRGLRKLDKTRAEWISKACDAIQRGLEEDPKHWAKHFPIDVFQTGSGTSTNMNVNEVIANVAAVEAGNAVGSRDPIHPNDHVNMGQSSNDTFPTAMQIAAATAVQEILLPQLRRLHKALAEKASRWDRIVKIGRTHLMDATPIRLGQEFSGYAAQIEYAIRRAESARDRLAENLPIGGTAVGTGINTHPEFGARVAARLAKATKIGFKEAPNHFEAQATRDCVVEASGHMRTIAVSLSKIANDIRWLGSGPRCGLFELLLPATQPGSSIMPGKVNPVICESVMMVACQVVGHDTALTLGGFGGIGSLLELNVAMPMMAENLQQSILLLANAAAMFVDRCIDGLEVNTAVATGTVEKSLMMCTSLAPIIGYDKAAEVAKNAFKSGETVREYVLRNKLVDPKRLDQLLDPWSMTEPGGDGAAGG